VPGVWGVGSAARPRATTPRGANLGLGTAGGDGDGDAAGGNRGMSGIAGGAWRARERHDHRGPVGGVGRAARGGGKRPASSAAAHRRPELSKQRRPRRAADHGPCRSAAGSTDLPTSSRRAWGARRDDAGLFPSLRAGPPPHPPPAPRWSCRPARATSPPRFRHPRFRARVANAVAAGVPEPQVRTRVRRRRRRFAPRARPPRTPAPSLPSPTVENRKLSRRRPRKGVARLRRYSVHTPIPPSSRLRKCAPVPLRATPPRRCAGTRPFGQVRSPRTASHTAACRLFR